MVSLLGGRDTRLKAGVQTSPAMVDTGDAEKIKIPMLVMPSKDEPLDDYKKYMDAVPTSTKSKMEYFDKMPHGWMSARGDLKDEEGLAEYERGYRLAVEFFNEHL